jgi:hypothetical protein
MDAKGVEAGRATAGDGAHGGGNLRRMVAIQRALQPSGVGIAAACRCGFPPGSSWIVRSSPPRHAFLKAGIVDALAKWFEFSPISRRTATRPG